MLSNNSLGNSSLGAQCDLQEINYHREAGIKASECNKEINVKGRMRGEYFRKLS